MKEYIVELECNGTFGDCAPDRAKNYEQAKLWFEEAVKFYSSADRGVTGVALTEIIDGEYNMLEFKKVSK